MKNQTYRMTMLYDFYGELLTERQKEFFGFPMSVLRNLLINDPAASCGVLREVAPLHIVEYAILLCLRFFFI